MKFSLALTLLTACAFGQETPTEREAARVVLQKMDALEKSLDVPGWVAKLSAPDAARDAITARARQLMDTELLAMGDDITRHPEIGFQETRSVGILVDYLKAHKFDVTVGLANLSTAFVARYQANRGAPNLGVIVEYDALRGTKGAFHGDQHSTQGPIGLAVAVAMAEWLAKSGAPGSVVVFGCPGEEMMPPNAKVDMFQAGVFDGMDIIVRSHAVSSTNRPAPGFGTCCLNIDGVKYTFSGAPAHQMTPWAGRNALEAVIHLFNNIDAARTTMRPEARVQGIITEGGAAPNVVPDRTQADFYIRYPDAIYLAQVREAVDNAAKAAALRHRHEGEDRQLRPGARRHLGGAAGGCRLGPHEALRRHTRFRDPRQTARLRRDRQRVERHPWHWLRRLHLQRCQPHLRDGGRRADLRGP